MIDILRVSDLSHERSIQTDGRIAGLEFSATGEVLSASIGAHGVVGWAAQSGDEIWNQPWSAVAGVDELPETFQREGPLQAAMTADLANESILIRAQAIGTAELEASTGAVVGRWSSNLTDHRLTLSPLTDGRLIVGTTIIDRETGDEQRQILTNTSNVAGHAVLPGESVVVQATGDGLVVWSPDGQQLLARAAPRQGANFAYLDASGDRLAMNNMFTGDYHQWDLAEGKGFSPNLDPQTLMISWLPGGGFMTYETDGETKAYDPSTFVETGHVASDNWFFTQQRIGPTALLARRPLSLGRDLRGSGGHLGDQGLGARWFAAARHRRHLGSDERERY